MGFIRNFFAKVTGADKIEQRYINIANTLEIKARQNSPYQAAVELADAILNIIGNSKKLARQFVLEEIDQVKQSDLDFVIDFIDTSGFSRSEYIGSMKQSKSSDEKKILKEVQDIVGNITYHFNDKGLMTIVYISMLDHIMKKWCLGKYAD